MRIVICEVCVCSTQRVISQYLTIQSQFQHKIEFLEFQVFSFFACVIN